MANPILIMISRGLCPPTVVTDAVNQSIKHGAMFAVLSGLGRVAAKQAAVEVALENEADLILVEDDVEAGDWQWDEVFASEGEILYADGKCRDGSPSFRIAQNGDRIGGTMLVRIPLEVLRAIPEPVFESRWIYFDETVGTWEDRGPMDGDRHSDIVFWYKVHHLDPRPVIRCIGTVDHLKHPLNDGSWPHDGPIEVETF